MSVEDATSVEVTGDDNIVPMLRTEVRGETLHIRTEFNGSIQSTSQLVATIVAPSLERVDASDAVVTATESIHGDCSGASSVRYSGSPGNADVSTSGASSAKPE